jgi:hypothetical protein
MSAADVSICSSTTVASVEEEFDSNKSLKRKRSDSITEDDTATIVLVSTSAQEETDSQIIPATEQSTSPTPKPENTSVLGFKNATEFASVKNEAEAVLFSNTYQPYLFNPTIPTGYCFGGMRLEMFRTDTIGGSVGDIYFVCAESFFNTAGPLGLKLTLSTQGLACII